MPEKSKHTELEEQIQELLATFKQIRNLDIGGHSTLDKYGWCSQCYKIQTLVSIALDPKKEE